MDTMRNFFAVFMVLLLSGCETEQTSQRPTYDPNTQVVIDKTEYTRLQNAKAGRFQPFKNVTGVALDTSTGQLCKTHDWHESPLPPCPKHGMATEPCVIGRSPYENAPLCSSLPCPFAVTSPSTPARGFERNRLFATRWFP